MSRLGIAVVGALGRMGRAVTAASLLSDDLKVAALVVRTGSPELARGAGPDLPAPTDDLDAAARQADVLVDFSLPHAFEAVVEAARRHHKPLVSGTTGVAAEQLDRLDELAAVAPCPHSPNMSVGVQVLLDLVARAAAALGPAYDLALTETHHRYKRDAPSGTAKRILDALGKAWDPPRPADSIPAFALRGGDVVGDHSVHFLGPGDRLEVTHRATSRDTFALGALRAARWLVRQPPGRYDFRQVLGLNPAPTPNG